MNHRQKHFFPSRIALAVLLTAAPMGAWAQDLGSASTFSVLGASVTCTSSVIGGDVGISPPTAFTNTGCTIAGGMPPATNTAAVGARADFLDAYAEIKSDTATPCTGTLLSTIAGPVTLAPGVYCTGAALTGAGVLTLDATGSPDPAAAVWIFKIGAALTGTNFSVVMAGGGRPCNVYWAPSAGVTMTTSAISGNILAGGATGEITLTGGTLAGRALANVAVSMTDTSVFGCGALSGPVTPGTTPGFPFCKDKDHDGHDKDHHDKDHHDKDHHDKDGHDKDGHDKDGHDDGKGDGSHNNPFGSNDRHDSKNDKSSRR